MGAYRGAEYIWVRGRDGFKEQGGVCLGGRGV